MPEFTLLNPRPVPTVLVSRPGILRQSLRASLAACSWIEVVAAFGDGLTTLNKLAEFGPGIVVIDSNLLDEEVDALVVAIKANYPHVRCLVLTCSGSREARMLARGTDAVVDRDASGQDLREKLLKLAQGSID